MGLPRDCNPTFLGWGLGGKSEFDWDLGEPDEVAGKGGRGDLGVRGEQTLEAFDLGDESLDDLLLEKQVNQCQLGHLLDRVAVSRELG